MNLKWSFIVNGNHSYLHDLCYHLDCADITVYEEGEEGIDLTTYFSSVHLNHLTNPNDIYSKAYQICSFLNGIEFLIYEDNTDRGHIRLEQLIDITHNKVVQFNRNELIHHVDIDFSINQTTKKISNHLIAEIMAVLKSNTFMQNILFMCGQEKDFRAIYQILDEVKTYLSMNGTSLKNLGISKDEIDLFKQTANNYQTLGLAARHGNLGHQKPKSPMTLAEAEHLIGRIIRTTLENIVEFRLPYVNKQKDDVSSFL